MVLVSCSPLTFITCPTGSNHVRLASWPYQALLPMRRKGCRQARGALPRVTLVSGRWLCGDDGHGEFGLPRECPESGSAARLRSRSPSLPNVERPTFGPRIASSLADAATCRGPYATSTGIRWNGAWRGRPPIGPGRPRGHTQATISPLVPITWDPVRHARHQPSRATACRASPLLPEWRGTMMLTPRPGC